MEERGGGHQFWIQTKCGDRITVCPANRVLLRSPRGEWPPNPGSAAPKVFGEVARPMVCWTWKGTTGYPFAAGAVAWFEKVRTAESLQPSAPSGPEQQRPRHVAHSREGAETQPVLRELEARSLAGHGTLSRTVLPPELPAGCLISDRSASESHSGNLHICQHLFLPNSLLYGFCVYYFLFRMLFILTNQLRGKLIGEEVKEED